MVLFSLRLVFTIIVLTGSLTAAASPLRCSALLFPTVDYNFSSPIMFGAPIPEPLVNRIHDQQKLDEVNFESFDQDRYVVSWGLLRTGRISYPVFEAMVKWTPQTPRAMDLIVYKTRLQELATQASSKGHFSGDVKDIERLLKQLRLEVAEIQEHPTFFRVGVQVRTEENFKKFQGAMSYAAILPYAVTAAAPFERNFLMRMPESEKIELANRYNRQDGDVEYWGWANFADQGRISYAALERIAGWDKKTKITFQVFVMRTWMGYLHEKEPKTFTGTEADLQSVLRHFKSLQVSQLQIDPADIRIDVAVENAAQLGELYRFFSGAVIRPAIVLKE